MNEMQSEGLVFFDTETTGLPLWNDPSDDPRQPHLVQLACGVFTPEREMISSLDILIRPDGWGIPEEVSKIHRITTDMAFEYGVPESEAIELFLSLLGTRKRVAHNTTFDNRIIRIALKRMFSADAQKGFSEGDYYCTMVNGSKILGGKWPKLTEIYKKLFGSEMEGAHDAFADMEACAHVYFKLKEMEAENEKV